MILKQTFLKHVYPLRFTFVFGFLFLFICWYNNFNESLLTISAITFGVLTLPVLYLHVSYSIANANETITIEDGELIIKKDGSAIKYFQSDIERIFIFKSASLDSGIPFSGMDFYFFARIVMKNNEEVVITCLLTNNIEKMTQQFPKVPTEVIYGFTFLCRRE